MTTEIHVISGFLGAGKTTLIQKLLQEAFKGEKVVLIENDFGDISVDAALLQSGGVEVKELNSGCICCSLSGDFVKALKELLDRFHPDKVIIEPSGVGKLSDIMKVCSDPHIQPLAKIKSKITVADVKRCKMYLDNFGEFFEDQIQHADVILLSRTEDFPDKVNDACKLLKSLNAQAVILTKPWNQIRADEILFPRYGRHAHGESGGHVLGASGAPGEPHSHAPGEPRGHGSSVPGGHDPCTSSVSSGHGPGCGCHHHGTHDHSDHRDCGHGHSAEEVFDTVTVRTDRKFTVENLKARLHQLKHNQYGAVLRAKGIVRGVNGYLNMQYLPGDLKITNCFTGGEVVCIIGRNLNRQELIKLFN